MYFLKLFLRFAEAWKGEETWVREAEPVEDALLGLPRHWSHEDQQVKIEQKIVISWFEK